MVCCKKLRPALFFRLLSTDGSFLPRCFLNPSICYFRADKSRRHQHCLGIWRSFEDTYSGFTRGFTTNLQLLLAGDDIPYHLPFRGCSPLSDFTFQRSRSKLVPTSIRGWEDACGEWSCKSEFIQKKEPVLYSYSIREVYLHSQSIRPSTSHSFNCIPRSTHSLLHSLRCISVSYA
jgi:hypothetical protein